MRANGRDEERFNAHQWLLYIPLHHLRHNQQIAEVKASAAYRKLSEIVA